MTTENKMTPVDAALARVESTRARRDEFNTSMHAESVRDQWKVPVQDEEILAAEVRRLREERDAHKASSDIRGENLAELREDAARLDWMDKPLSIMPTAIDSDIGRMFFSERVSGDSRILHTGFSVRAAIDAARKAAK